MKRLSLLAIVLIILLILGVLYIYTKKEEVESPPDTSKNAALIQEPSEAPATENTKRTDAVFDPSTLKKGDRVGNFVTTNIEYDSQWCEYLKASFKGSAEIVGTFGKYTENAVGELMSPQYDIHDIATTSAISIPHPKTEERVFFMDIKPEQISLVSTIQNGDRVRAAISGIEIYEVCKGEHAPYIGTITAIQKW